MLKKKNKKPIYFKKSKAAKQREQEENYNIYSDSTTSVLEPAPMKYKPQQSFKPRKKSERYREEYEYSGYEDPYDDYNPYKYQQYESDFRDQPYYNEYGGNQNYNEYVGNQYYNEYGGNQYYNDFEDQSMYEKGNETYDYTTEDAQYHQRPGKIKPQYSMTEIDYSDRSDSDCEICNNKRKGRRRENKDNISEYNYVQPKRRHKHRSGWTNRRPVSEQPETTETERGPYRGDYNVYLARHSVGHKAFRHKKEQEETESESGSMSGEGESDMPLEKHRGKPQYQVYAAHTKPNYEVFGQDPTKERLMSMTDYEKTAGNIPVVGFKDKKGTLKGNPSELVYLPIIMVDDDGKLPKSKIVSPEALMKENKAEKPLESPVNNIHVYAASNLNQENIFRHADTNDPTANPLVYTVQQEKAPSLEGKKSRLSTVFNKLAVGRKSKTTLQESEYPIRKSYIKTAPPILTKTESKGSMKPRGSVIGISEMEKDENKKSVVNTNLSKENTRTSKVPPLQKSTTQNASLDSNLDTGAYEIVNIYDSKISTKPETKVSKAYIPEDQRKMSVVENESKLNPLRQSRAETSPKRKSMAHVVSKGPQTISEAKDETRRTHHIGDTIEHKKEEPKKGFSQRPSEVPKLVSECWTGKESVAKPPSPRRSLASRIFGKKKKEPKDKQYPESETENYDYESPSNMYQPKLKIAPTDKRRADNVQRTRSKKGIVKKGSRATSKDNQLILWGYDMTFIVYIFQTCQFFLGLSIHEKLMEMFSTFDSDHY